MGKILVVDDDADFRVESRDILKGEGFDVFEASGGRNAIKQFVKERPDAVLLDLNMQGMGGMEVFRELKKIDHRIPVIILTGFGNVPISVEAVKSGVYDFIEKPPDFEKLISVLTKAVEYKKSVCNSLSPKEAEVLRLIVCGETVSDTADKLKISVNTVKSHSKHIKEKLGSKNITQAAVKAVARRIIAIR